MPPFSGLPDYSGWQTWLNPVAACPDDRVDELTESILVPAVHKLGKSSSSIRSLVVAPGKVERAERIVRRTDLEHCLE